MNVRVGFGPLAYRIHGPDDDAVQAWCREHEAVDDTPSFPVHVERVDALPDAVGEAAFQRYGYTVFRGADEHRVYALRERPSSWVAALSALVAHDAPSVQALVIHCAAVRVEGGVALLIAPSGTGKTTFARNAGERSFAHNAVIVRAVDAGSWYAHALPFAGDPNPDLDKPGSAAVRCLALLLRGDQPGFEWIPPSEATIAVVRACVRAPVPDRWARERFMLASALASTTAVGKLKTTRGLHDLDALDSALQMENDR